MSDVVIDRIDRLTESLSRLDGLLGKVPRLIGTLGAALFGGRASEKLGGDFNTGALGGMLVHDLAHSQLPNNQLAGIAIGIYFTGLGIMNMVPIIEQDFEDRIEEFDRSLKSTEERLTRGECTDQGGIPTKIIFAVRPDGTTATRDIPAGFDANLIPPSIPVVCSFPANAPIISAGLERRAQRFGEAP